MKLRGVAGVVMPSPVELVAFTPKGGCPLKRLQLRIRHAPLWARVAFTPKGGCPLKPCVSASGGTDARTR